MVYNTPPTLVVDGQYTFGFLPTTHHCAINQLVVQFIVYMATLIHMVPFINTIKLNKNNCHNSFSSWNTPYSSINHSHTQFRFPAKRNGGIVCAISNSPGNSIQVISEDTPSLLNKVNVFDLNGKAIIISDLWKDRRAVVAFARHFGCVLCRKRADYLATAKDKMDAAGVALILIGPGRVDQAKAFVEQTNFKGEVYADPDYSSYEALSFVSGISTTFTPKAGLKIIQLYMEGYRQDWGLSFDKDTRTKGGWQQGGIIVAGPGKTNISYVHKDKEAGDDPDIKEILEACCSQ